MEHAKFEGLKPPFEAVVDFVDGLDASEAPAAEERAHSLLHPGGKFRHLEQYVAIVPVAAHEENPETVTHAVEQYARQTKNKPFTLVLGLNWPDNTEQHQRAHTLVRHSRALARDMRGRLDMRVLGEQYADPTIGRIRRDLWNAVLVAGLESGTIRQGLETIGMNGDIDLVHMPRWTVAAIQKAMHQELDPHEKGYDYMPAWPRPVPMRHSTSPAHPRSSSVMVWHDWLNRLGHVSYEASMVISMGRYALHGGIAPDAASNEVLDIRDAAAAHPLGRTYVPTASIVTSGRRYIWRLLESGLDEVWGEGSFGVNSVYRHDINQFPDISKERQIELISGTGSRVMDAAERSVHFGRLQGTYEAQMKFKELRRTVRHTLTFAERMLPRIVGEEWQHEEPFSTVRKLYDVGYPGSS